MTPADQTRPDRYALATATGPAGGRAVLFALAIRANVNCGIAIGGDWLKDTVGLSPGHIRRYIHAYADAGIVAVTHRDGGPLLVRFPTAGVVHNPAHQCAGCREWDRAYTQQTPRIYAADPAHPCAPKQKEKQSENTGDSQHNTACGHRWRSVSGECPICLADEQREAM